jgi:hypothetical protein
MAGEVKLGKKNFFLGLGAKKLKKKMDWEGRKRKG